MRNFNTWAASFFSWGETPNEAEIEGYELAYNAGREHAKQEILEMISNAPRNNPNLMSTFQMNQQSDMMKKIEKL